MLKIGDFDNQTLCEGVVVGGQDAFDPHIFYLGLNTEYFLFIFLANKQNIAFCIGAST